MLVFASSSRVVRGENSSICGGGAGRRAGGGVVFYRAVAGPARRRRATLGIAAPLPSERCPLKKLETRGNRVSTRLKRGENETAASPQFPGREEDEGPQHSGRGLTALLRLDAKVRRGRGPKHTSGVSYAASTGDDGQRPGRKSFLSKDGKKEGITGRTAVQLGGSRKLRRPGP